MATIHVWSGSTGASAPYATWGTATTALVTATLAAVAGDTIYVAHDHAESAATPAYAPASSSATPTRIICGTRTGSAGESGISALAMTGRVTFTGVSMTLGGTSIYVYGVEFEQSSASSTEMKLFAAAANGGILEDCKFICTGNNANTRIMCGSYAAATGQPLVHLIRPQFKFSSSSQGVIISGGVLQIDGGSPTAVVGSTPTAFCQLGVATGFGGAAYINGFDFSTYSAGFDLFREGSQPPSRGEARNCKMPSGWSGDLIATAPVGTGTYIALVNYGDGDTNYKFWTQTIRGHCREETTIYRINGAEDEVIPHSIRMQTTSTAGYPSAALRSPPMMKRIPAGTSAAVSVRFVYEGAARLKNNEIWIEVEYLGTSGFPLATFASSRVPVNVAPSDVLDSVASWNGASGTGLNGDGTWFEQVSGVSGGGVVPLVFAESCFAVATICFAKASRYVYIDPELFVNPI